MHSRSLPSKRSFYLNTVLLSGLMGFQLFFLVTGEGTWQDMGNSLSRFVIAEMLSLALALLAALAAAAMRIGGFLKFVSY